MSGSPDQLDGLAGDVTSSATVLLEHAYRALCRARERGPEEAARAAVAVCRAQPSMGALWTLAAVAMEPDGAAMDRLIQRARRAPAAIARQAADLLGPATGTRRVLTCSRSAAVEVCLRAMAGRAAAARVGLSVVCAESRPGLEGRALASALASGGVAVEVVSDAAIAAELGDGDLVLVGADAVAADWFINKAGTRPLCAAATLASVPAYVVAGREKFVPEPLARRLLLRAHDPADIWRDPGPGVVVTNRLFERVPLDHVAAVLTDAGLLAGDMVRAACDAAPESAIARLLDALSVA